jgi:hypothetical protein
MFVRCYGNLLVCAAFLALTGLPVRADIKLTIHDRFGASTVYMKDHITVVVPIDNDTSSKTIINDNNQTVTTMIAGDGGVGDKIYFIVPFAKSKPTISSIPVAPRHTAAINVGITS